MDKCKKLQWYRKKLRLSQQGLAHRVGLNVNTIIKLEKDETAWTTLRQTTVDKIMDFYDSVNKGDWEFDKEVAKKQLAEIKETVESTEEPVEEVVEPEPVIEIKTEPVVIDDSSDLTYKDRTLMKYVEFACGNLHNSKSHEEFITNVDILRRIIENQY
jgi:transcriptional regulator with XRE-family HTH domain